MPTKTTSKSFSAVLQRNGNSLHWVTIEIPFDVGKLWGSRGTIPVTGNINGFAFRTSLFPSGGGRHIMVVNKQMQKKANALPGMTARFQLQHDIAKRPTPATPELDRVLRQCRPLQKYYQSLSPSLRKDFARYISAAKQPETRIRRAEQLAVRLIETMEAEVELPPLLRQAFSRNPIAAKGWQKMPPSHRRMHLLGIFYYRDLSSRLNRIEKAMVEIERFALRQDLRISQ